MSEIFSIIGAALGGAGAAFIIAAGARAGWDFAGLHTRKAPTVTNTYVKMQEPEGGQ